MTRLSFHTVSLRFKFVSSITLLLVLTLSITANHVYRTQEELLQSSLDAKVESTGKFVAMIAPTSIYAFDITALDRHVAQIRKDPDILYAQITDTEGRSLTTISPGELQGEVIAQVLSGSYPDPALYQLRFPVTDEGARIGEVRMVVDRTRLLNALHQNLIEQLLIYLGIILFLATVIIAIFHISVLRPVNFLVAGASRIGRGQYESKVPLLSDDELGQLASCFNEMAEKIRLEQQELKTANTRLTEEVEQRRQAEEGLRLAANVFTSAREGIIITDTDGIILDVNSSFSEITGYPRDEAVGKNPRFMQSGRHTKEFYQSLWKSLEISGFWMGEIWNRRKSGELILEFLTISTVRDSQGEVEHYVALFSDITEQKRQQQQLEYHAHYDALTNLPNRVLLADRLQQAMLQVGRRGTRLAVAYIDLDGFKEINDSYGHDIGDKLLMSVAGRLKGELREGDTIARLGGDEFVAVLLDLNAHEEELSLLDRMLESASSPILIDTMELKVTASIGVTFFPQNEEIDADQLLRQADQAMYQAKLSGKNHYHLFDADFARDQRGQHEGIERIRMALQRDEFELYYQPKVNMRSGIVVGAEALIRWNHPEDGLLTPNFFLPLVNDHELAVDIGEWVICTSLKQIQSWVSEGIEIPISVNIAGYHLQKSNFITRLTELLSEHKDVKPSLLQLEVLETSIIDDLDYTARVMQDCLEMGVGFALDDFGTGYSSLTYLKHLPANLLKIDQSFVRDMLDDADDLAIAEGIIGLATAFRRTVLAEGVESVAHGRLLLQLGCELAQGYGIARPMPARNLPEWLQQWQPDSSWQAVAVIDQHDLPVLYAAAEHRSWVRSVREHIQGKQVSSTIHNIDDCRLGKWLSVEGIERYADTPAFSGVNTIHQDIHLLAEELLTLHTQGQSAIAQGRLDELTALRDSLLEKLDEMISR